jgi:acyl dehydratase
LETRAGRRAARGLHQNLQVALLPTAMKSLDQGAVVASVSNRWVTPVFYNGKLRLIFVLPAEIETDRLRGWRRIVNTWNACGDASDVSHVHSG